RLDALNQRSVQSALRTSYAGGAIGIVYQGTALLLMIAALGIAHAAGATRLSSLGAIVLIMLRSLSYAQSFQQNLQSVHQSAPYLEALKEEEARYRTSSMQHGGEPVDEIGSLAFEGVSFEYEPGVPVLRDVSF